MRRVALLGWSPTSISRALGPISGLITRHVRASGWARGGGLIVENNAVSVSDIHEGVFGGSFCSDRGWAAESVYLFRAGKPSSHGGVSGIYRLALSGLGREDFLEADAYAVTRCVVGCVVVRGGARTTRGFTTAGFVVGLAAIVLAG